jgi:hypothetical protein
LADTAEVSMQARVTIRLVIAVGMTGCESGSDHVAARLPRTEVDSTGDTVVVRVVGDVPANAVRTLVEEVRIAPGVEDTSLFTKATHVAVDRADRAWVFDESSGSVFLFGADGTLLRRIGRKGNGPGEIEQAGGIAALPDTGLAVWDLGNGRITFFDGSGAFRTGWRLTELWPYQGPFVDRRGNIYLDRAIDEGDRVIRAVEQAVGELPRHVLVRVSAEGEFVDSLVPARIAIEPLRYTARDRGIRATYAAPSAPTALWALHPDGYLVTGNGRTFEVVVPRPGTKPLVIRRSSAPVPIPGEEQEEERARITYYLRQTDPGWTWTGPPLPSTKPPLVGLTIGREGRIWAQVAAAADRIPAAELETPKPPDVPIRHFRARAVFEVFESDGRFHGRIRVPARFTLIGADGNRVWGTVEDENDLIAIVRYRIEPSLQ